MENASKNMNGKDDSPAADVTGVSDLLLPQNFAELMKTRDEITRVPIRRPNKQSFFCAHPGDGEVVKAALFTPEGDDEPYILTSNIADLLADDGVVQYRMLVPCVTKRGSYFYWPIGLPNDEGKMNPWHQSALNVYLENRGTWIRLLSDMQSSSYTVRKPEVDYGEPDWSKYDKDEFCVKALSKRAIRDENHHAVKLLLGRKV